MSTAAPSYIDARPDAPPDAAAREAAAWEAPPEAAVADAPCRPSGGRYVVDGPGPGDDAALAALLALPMGGRMRLSMRPGPDRDAAAAWRGERGERGEGGGRGATVLVRDRETGRPVATGSRSVRTLWINGEPARVGYLSGLRNTPGVRLPRRVIAAAFNRLLNTRHEDEAAFDLTAVMADNAVARRALERGVPGLPTYTPLGGLLTVTVRAGGRRRAVPSGEPAEPAEVVALLHEDGRRFQARPVWNDTSLACSGWHGVRRVFCVQRQNGRLCRSRYAALPDACAAVWDQRPARRMVIDGLAPPLAWSRRPLNAALRLAGYPAIPAAGAALPMVFLSHLATRDGDPQKLHDVIHSAAALAAGCGEPPARLATFGLPDTPDHRRLTRRLRGWVSRSMIYAVHRGPPPRLDGRPVWPEAALL